MKKVVLASLLAIAGVALWAQPCFAQTPSGQAQANGKGDIQMPADEYKAYNDANTAATPQAKAAGFEAYLKAYPNSQVKADALLQLLIAYSQSNDIPHTLDAADRLLQVSPNNIQALTFEVYLHKQQGDAMTDPAGKAAELSKAAAFAQTALNVPKDPSMSDSDWAALKAKTMPTFESAIADSDLAAAAVASANKDTDSVNKNAGAAVTALTAELNGIPEPQTRDPHQQLQDVFTLAQAYYASAPPDYLNCAWYGARADAFAPEPYKSQNIHPLAIYCYSKYHGNRDGYDKLLAMVQTSLNPPADLKTTITPAPKPADIVANLIATTPDLATLAPSDREFVLQYGGQPDPKCTPTADVPCKTNADKAFDAVKGKSVEFPNVVVVSATADKVLVAVSDDAVQGKAADFEFDMKAPLKTVPAAGDKVTLTGTYSSYVTTPTVMFTMSDAAVVLKKPVAPVHHTTTPAHRPAARH